MKENMENIDLLINENTDQQLSSVDWDQLYGRIQKRLDTAKKPVGTVSMRRNLFRWAVGISSAAAVLLFIFTLMDDNNTMIPLPPGQRAVVKVTENQTVVKVEIKKLNDSGYASVAIQPTGNKIQADCKPQEQLAVQCDVTIIDQNGHTENNDMRPSWIMMMASSPAPAENKTDNDQLDIACLL